MKINTLRKIYPYLSTNYKNVNWERVGGKHFKKTMQEKQKTSNCFSNAVRVALFNSIQGKKILKSRVKREKNAEQHPSYKFILSPNGKEEVYRVSRLDYFSKFFSAYRTYNETYPRSGNFQDSVSKDLNLAYDIAISKMVSKHPEQKPWYLRLYCFPYNKKYEYNVPSRSFEWFTGIKPIAIGEKGFRSELYRYKDEVLNLLEKLGNLSNKDYSFVLMSGRRKTPVNEKWHCLPILSVDNENKRVHIIDKRFNEKFDISFDTVLYNYKAIVGINWQEELKK